MTLNTTAKIGLGVCMTGVSVSLGFSEPDLNLTTLGLGMACQALVWMPDLVSRCVQSVRNCMNPVEDESDILLFEKRDPISDKPIPVEF
jgi:hypothetical protein